MATAEHRKLHFEKILSILREIFSPVLSKRNIVYNKFFICYKRKYSYIHWQEPSDGKVNGSGNNGGGYVFIIEGLKKLRIIRCYPEIRI